MIFYLRMAWHSLLRRRGLTLVMIGALSLGISTWYVQHQIFAFLDSKTPAINDAVFQVNLDRGEHDRRGHPLASPLVPSVLLAPHDAERVLANAPRRSVITFSAKGLIEPTGRAAETVQVRYSTRDLFELFAIPMAAGRPWSGDDEVVIDERLANRLFGGRAIGNQLRVDGVDLRVVGVVDDSHDARFRYHLYERFANGSDSVYLPLAHAAAANAQPSFMHAIAGGESGYVTAWVELSTAEERAAFIAAAPRTVTLRSSAEWREVFAPAGAITVWPLLSGLCLVTAIVNLVRMLMAKFAGRSHDLGLLRAFGARQRAVMGQLLLEAVLIGFVAGVLGVVLGVIAMPLAASTVVSTPGVVSTIDLAGVLATLGASIGAAVLAALYPAWSLARGTPAVQMRVP